MNFYQEDDRKGRRHGMINDYLKGIIDDVMNLLSAARVRVVILAPHIKQFLQLFDPTLFPTLAREEIYHFRPVNLGTTARFVYNVDTTIMMTKTLPSSNTEAPSHAIVVQTYMIIGPPYTFGDQKN
jgi:hypothetical protein